jgi:hypothetical protein
MHGEYKGAQDETQQEEDTMEVDMQTRIEMDKYDTLQKIVEQLESRNYETDGRRLECNMAFLKLKEMAIEQQRISNAPILSDVRELIAFCEDVRKLHTHDTDHGVMIDTWMYWVDKVKAHIR